MLTSYFMLIFAEAIVNRMETRYSSKLVDCFSYPAPEMSRYPAHPYFPIDCINHLDKTHSVYQAPVLKVLRSQRQIPYILSH